MTYKVVRDTLGNVLSYGPNDNNYVPSIPAGCTLNIEATMPLPTFAQRQKALERDVQRFMDEKAQAMGYDNILSACSYASVVNPFQAEGISFLNWRSACWSFCYTLLAQVVAGTAVEPTSAQLIAMLPVRV